MGTLVKICLSPYTPNLQVFEDVVIKAQEPYSDEYVTIEASPNVQHYQKHQGLADTQVRHVTATSDADETVSVQLDLHSNPEETITVAGIDYEIKLMSIGKESQHGQNFPNFEFDVTKI